VGAARRGKGQRHRWRAANAVHPGVIQTNLARRMNPFFGASLGAAGPLVLKSIAQGAATQVYVATNPAVAAVSGKYFADCNVTAPRA
jgi:WW domain-containing oxidoreductase